MPPLALIRALFSLIVAGVLALFAAGSAVPPQELAVIQSEAVPEVRTLPQAPEMVATEDSGEKATSETPSLTPSPTPQPPQTTLPTEETAPPVAPAPSSKLSLGIIDTQTRGAVVHLLCTTRDKRTIRITTGSGVVIDPRGVVLTNAHVAQFWLLPEESALGTTECRVRAAVPVDREFRAELLYFPTQWITEHAQDFDNPNPKGTGEHDYALLRITDPVKSTIIHPAVFPFVSVNVSADEIEEGNGILIAAYPASGTIEDADDLQTLDIVSTVTTIQRIFTFDTTTLDLISLGSSSLSFKGSSGGAVMNEDNQLIGLITTSTDGDNALDRELRAITLAHINRSLVSHTGFTLAGLLSGNIEQKSAAFLSAVAPKLSNALLSEL